MLFLSEDEKVGNVVETFLVASNPDAYRGIRCRVLELSTSVSDGHNTHGVFDITTGVPSSITGISRCLLRLNRPLDFEARSAYVLQVGFQLRTTTRSMINTGRLIPNDFEV